MKNYLHITKFGITKLSLNQIIIFLFIFFVFTTTAKSQFFDALSNPQVSVKIDHPPGLGLMINKIAFNTATGNCADQIIDALISDFVSNNVEVIDRGNLTTILAEHNFNFTGYVDKTTAVEIGKIIGPSALVTVKVLRCETKTQSDLYKIETRNDYVNKVSYNVRVNIARTSVFLKVSLQTTDLATGRIFAARVLDYAPVRENHSEQGIPEAPSEFDVQEAAFQSLVGETHRLFFPWSHETLLYYFDDKDGGLKQAYGALKAGDKDLAFNLSLQNLETCKKTNGIKPKILAHAYYNLGMSYMIKGEYDKAIENFNESQKLRPGTIVTEAIAKCNYSKNEAIELQKVDDKAIIEAVKSQNETNKAVQADVASTLLNSDIIGLTQKKLPNTLILQKIKTSKCKFDTSTDALIALSKAGVNEDVIMAMMEKK